MSNPNETLDERLMGPEGSASWPIPEPVFVGPPEPGSLDEPYLESEGNLLCNSELQSVGFSVLHGFEQPPDDDGNYSLNATAAGMTMTPLPETSPEVLRELEAIENASPVVVAHPDPMRVVTGQRYRDPLYGIPSRPNRRRVKVEIPQFDSWDMI